MPDIPEHFNDGAVRRETGSDRRKNAWSSAKSLLRNLGHGWHCWHVRHMHLWRHGSRGETLNEDRSFNWTCSVNTQQEIIKKKHRNFILCVIWPPFVMVTGLKQWLTKPKCTGEVRALLHCSACKKVQHTHKHACTMSQTQLVRSGNCVSVLLPRLRPAGCSSHVLCSLTHACKATHIVHA